MRKWDSLHGTQRITIDGPQLQDSKLIKKGGDIHDMQVKCVCGGDKKSCNNGWMREIENLAKPIIIPLMKGEEIRISPDEQKIIAAWCSLKAMVAEFGRLVYVTTPQEEREYMMKFKLPPEQGWAIWIGCYERNNWPGYMNAHAFAYWPEPERAHLLGTPTTDYNGQSSFQVVKKLFIQIIRCSVPELVKKWRFEPRATNVLRQIWPPTGYSIVWPPPVMSDEDADYVASALPVAIATMVQRKLAREAGNL